MDVYHQEQSEEVLFTAPEAPNTTFIQELQDRTKQPCSLCVRMKLASNIFLMGKNPES